MSDASVTLLREHTDAAERNCCATSSSNFGKTSEASLLVCYNTTPLTTASAHTLPSLSACFSSFLLSLMLLSATAVATRC